MQTSQLQKGSSGTFTLLFSQRIMFGWSMTKEKRKDPVFNMSAVGGGMAAVEGHLVLCARNINKAV